METSTAPSHASILDYVQAKRQQFDQRLDALQLLQYHPSQGSNGGFDGNWNSNNSTCHSFYPIDSTDSLHRVDSSEWLESFGAFVPLSKSDTTSSTGAPTPPPKRDHHHRKQLSSLSLGPAVSSNGHGNFTYAPRAYLQRASVSSSTSSSSKSPPPPSHDSTTNSHSNSSSSESLSELVHLLKQQQQQQQQDNNDLFVVSDRLAAILPDLDMLQDITSGSSKTPGSSGPQQATLDRDPMPPLAFPTLLPQAIPSNEGASRLSRNNNTSDHHPTVAAVQKKTKKTPAKKARHTALDRTSQGAKRKLGRPSAFPQKLLRMLTEQERDQTPDSHNNSHGPVVGFTPDGSAFAIYDNDAFVADILPRYFNMTSFSSFQRQLQLYSFKRQGKGGPYGHPQFHRHATPEMVGLMTRKQSRPISHPRADTTTSPTSSGAAPAVTMTTNLPFGLSA